MYLYALQHSTCNSSADEIFQAEGTFLVPSNRILSLISDKRHEEEQDMFDHMHGENFDDYEDYKHLMADSVEL